MAHNYSLRKLQTAKEPTQTPILLPAHAKLSSTGNDSGCPVMCSPSDSTCSAQKTVIFLEAESDPRPVPVHIASLLRVPTVSGNRPSLMAVASPAGVISVNARSCQERISIREVPF